MGEVGIESYADDLNLCGLNDKAAPFWGILLWYVCGTEWLIDEFIDTVQDHTYDVQCISYGHCTI